MTAAVLVLLGFAFLGGRAVYFSTDRRQIMEITAVFKQAEHDRDYAKAYDAMSDAFRAKCDYANFPIECRRMNILTAPTLVIQWDRKRARLSPGMWCGGAVLDFTKTNAEWRCEGIADWYYD